VPAVPDAENRIGGSEALQLRSRPSANSARALRQQACGAWARRGPRLIATLGRHLAAAGCGILAAVGQQHSGLPGVPRCRGGRDQNAGRDDSGSQPRTARACRQGRDKPARCDQRSQIPRCNDCATRAGTPSAADGAVAARRHRRGEFDGLPRARGSRYRARRGGRLRAARRARGAGMRAPRRARNRGRTTGQPRQVRRPQPHRRRPEQTGPGVAHVHGTGVKLGAWPADTPGTG
jgi:hypothetical protein